MYHNSEGRKSRWQKYLHKWWNKKKKVQDKIDDLAMQIHRLEEGNVELTQGTALSRRQHKRISHSELITNYDNMVKQRTY